MNSIKVKVRIQSTVAKAYEALTTQVVWSKALQSTS